jgi:hypothetical protein
MDQIIDPTKSELFGDIIAPVIEQYENPIFIAKAYRNYMEQMTKPVVTGHDANGAPVTSVQNVATLTPDQFYSTGTYKQWLPLKEQGAMDSLRQEWGTEEGLKSKEPFAGGINDAVRNLNIMEAAKRLQSTEPKVYERYNAMRYQQKTTVGAEPGSVYDIQSELMDLENAPSRPSDFMDVTPEMDKKAVEDYLLELSQPKTFGGKVVSGGSQLPTFMVEFMMTGGLEAIGSTAAKKIGEKLLKDYATKKVGQLTLKLVGWAGGTAVRGTVAFAPMTFENITQRETLQKLGVMEEEPTAVNIVKGYLDTLIEIGSESTGGALTKGGALALSKLPLGSKMVTGLKAAWMKTTGGTSGEFFRQLASKGGYSNIVGELGEERLGTVLRAITDTRDFGAGPDANVFQRLYAGVQQDIKQLPVELAVLSMPMVPGMLSNIHGLITKTPTTADMADFGPELSYGFTQSQLDSILHSEGVGVILNEEKLAEQTANLEKVVIPALGGDAKAQSVLDETLRKNPELVPVLESVLHDQQNEGVPGATEALASLDYDKYLPTYEELLDRATKGDAHAVDLIQNGLFKGWKDRNKQEHAQDVLESQKEVKPKEYEQELKKLTPEQQAQVQQQGQPPVILSQGESVPKNVEREVISRFRDKIKDQSSLEKVGQQIAKALGVPNWERLKFVYVNVRQNPQEALRKAGQLDKHSIAYLNHFIRNGGVGGFHIPRTGQIVIIVGSKIYDAGPHGLVGGRNAQAGLPKSRKWGISQAVIKYILVHELGHVAKPTTRNATGKRKMHTPEFAKWVWDSVDKLWAHKVGDQYVPGKKKAMSVKKSSPKDSFTQEEIDGLLKLGYSKIQIARMSVEEGRGWLGVKPLDLGDNFDAFDPSTQPMFYSKLSRLVEDKMAPAMQADQMLKWIKGQGIKDEEIEESGLNDLTGKVTKQQVLDTLAANNIQVVEVIKGDPRVMTPSELEEYHALIQKRKDTGYNSFDARDRLRWEVLDSIHQSVGQNTPTKFSGYQTPHGFDYRELLMMLPFTESNLPSGFSLVQNDRNGHWYIEGPADNPSGKARYAEGPYKQDALEEFGRHHGRGVFKSAHWNEPNIIAHIRFNTHVDKDGNKILFIEEIQSDWHQRGRKEGYDDRNIRRVMVQQADALREEWRSIIAEQREIVRQLAESTKIVDKDKSVWEAINELKYQLKKFPESASTFKPVLDKLSTLDNNRASVKDQLDALEFKLETRVDIPDGPFKKSWEELSFKRVLRYAAENGFNKIGWTTGLMQVNRYPDQLRQVVDTIAWDMRGYEQVRTLNAFKDKSTVVQVRYDKDGLITQSMPDGFEGKQLEELIGKTMATQVLSQPSGRIEGKDFTVGGEGMKGFYDKILPSIANKLAKKFGVKVSTTEIQVHDLLNYTRKYVGPEYTIDQMENAYSYMSARGGNRFISPFTGEVMEIQVNVVSYERAVNGILQQMYRGFNFNESIRGDMSQGLAEIMGGKFEVILPPVKLETVHSLEIPKEMELAYLESQPLFMTLPGEEMDETEEDMVTDFISSGGEVGADGTVPVPVTEKEAIDALNLMLSDWKVADKTRRREVKFLRVKQYAKVAAILDQYTGPESYAKALGALRDIIIDPTFAWTHPISEPVYRKLCEIITRKFNNKWNQIDAWKALTALRAGESLPIYQRRLLVRAFGIQPAQLPDAGRPKDYVDFIIDLWNLPRMLLAGFFDNSLRLRQEIIAAWNHPIIWAQTLVKSTKAMFNPEYYQNLTSEIYQRPNFELYQLMGLDITDMESGLENTAESNIGGKLLRYRPHRPGEGKLVNIFKSVTNVLTAPYRSAIRAADLGGNLLRANIADVYIDVNRGLLDEETDEGKQQWKHLGNLVNRMTGRTNLAGKPTIKKVSAVLAPLMFSLQLHASRIAFLSTGLRATSEQILSTLTQGKFQGQYAPTVRKALMNSFLKMTMGTIGMLALAHMLWPDEVSIDPEESRYGKIKIGNTYYDLTSGFGQYVRYISQMITGKKRSITGNRYKIGRGAVTEQFVRSKAAPALNIAWDFISGRKVTGEPVDWTDKEGVMANVWNYFSPMIMQDTADVLKNDPYQVIPAVLFSFFGGGMQSYPLMPAQQAVITKKKLAIETFGKQWDELGPDMQKALYTINPELEVMDKAVDAARNDWNNVSLRIKESQLAGKEVLKTLPPEIQKEMIDLKLTVGGLGRQVGSSSYFLNETRFQSYKDYTSKILNKVLPKVMASKEYQSLNDDIRYKLIESIVNKSKQIARNIVLNETKREDMVTLKDMQARKVRLNEKANR